MNDSRVTRQADDEAAGLCGTCEHVQVVTSGKGSRFYLCLRSRTDPRFPRYPPIPVLACIGYTPPKQATEGHEGRATEEHGPLKNTEEH